MVSNAWMIRSGSNGVLATDFLDKGIVAVGFGFELGAVDTSIPKTSLVSMFKETYPTWNDGQIGSAASQMVRFFQEVNQGDSVVTYDGDRRRYLLGKVASDPKWDTSRIPDYPWVRTVTWERSCSRDDLSVATRNTLGSTLTLFSLNESVQKDLDAHALPLNVAQPEMVAPRVKATIPTDVAAWEELRTSFLEKAGQFIEDRIAALDPYAMQDLVAGILRALGYRTQVSPKGSDLGRDIFASPDGLGLEQPRIFVEVKHRPTTQVSAPELRSFLGGRKTGDRCLYVSTGGFTREARYEAERADVPVTIINMVRLRELLVEHYERLELDVRELVPLDRVYWPGA